MNQQQEHGGLAEKVDQLEARVKHLEQLMKNLGHSFDLVGRRNEWIRTAPQQDLIRVNESNGKWWPEHLRE